MSRRGLHLTFDGCEGTGKSVLSTRLAEDLGAVLVKEPGQTAAGLIIRNLLLHNIAPLTPEARVLLFSADRQLTKQQIIDPALSKGNHVISDRSYLSTVAYQCYGEGVSKDYVARATNLALGGPYRPTRAVILDAPYEITHDRQIRQGKAFDNFEQRDQAFHTRVRNGFKTMVDILGPTALFVDTSGSEEEAYQLLRAGLVPTLEAYCV